MRTPLILVGVLIIISIGYFLYTSKTTDTMEEQQSGGVQVVPIDHASGVLKWGATTIYFDPVSADKFAGQSAADIVLITDVHGDHLSTTTLASLVGANTLLIVPQAVKDLLPPDLASRAKVLKNDESLNEKGFQINAVPMYNLPGESEHFHTKGRGNGYIIEKDGERVYIAGDTAGTPEMRALRDIDIAFVPMNLPYTMGVDEAASAVLDFKPHTVYPYHYRSPDGLSDVAKFKQLVNAGDSNIEVILGEWY